MSVHPKQMEMTTNSTYVESEPLIPALADAELDAVTGGLGFLVGAALFAAGFALGYFATTEIQMHLGDYPTGGAKNTC